VENSNGLILVLSVVTLCFSMAIYLILRFGVKIIYKRILFYVNNRIVAEFLLFLLSIFLFLSFLFIHFEFTGKGLLE